MRTIRNSFGSLAIIGGLIGSLSLLHAQTIVRAVQTVSTDDMAVMLQAVQATDPLPATDVPPIGTFFSAKNPNFPPMPGNVLGLEAWDLGGGYYLLDDLDLDGASAGAGMRAMAGSTMAMDASMPEGGDGGNYTSSYVSYAFDTNALWLEITNISNGATYLNLHNATNEVYEVWSKIDLLATNWNIEQEVWPDTNQTVTPFTVPQLDRTNLFIWARDWTGIDENSNGIPDWWEWRFFGNFNQPTNGDYDSDGTNILDEYQNGTDPNKIQFVLQFTNQYVNTSIAYGTITVLGGVPAYKAVMVNDNDFAAANWQPYSSNVVVLRWTPSFRPLSAENKIDSRGLLSWLLLFVCCSYIRA